MIKNIYILQYNIYKTKIEDSIVRSGLKMFAVSNEDEIFSTKRLAVLLS